MSDAPLILERCNMVAKCGNPVLYRDGDILACIVHMPTTKARVRLVPVTTQALEFRCECQHISVVLLMPNSPAVAAFNAGKEMANLCGGCGKKTTGSKSALVDGGAVILPGLPRGPR